MLIHLHAPDSPYDAKLDTDVMKVTITKAFLGAKFVTEDGEELSVCMRDSGFELVYRGKHYQHYDLSLQNGAIDLVRKADT